jgi:hypothetical protein
VRQIVSEQQDQHQQQVGCTVEHYEAEPDSNQRQHQQPERSYAWNAMIILGQCLFDFSEEQQQCDQHRGGDNKP